MIPTILAFKINEIQHKHHYPECHYAECCILFMAMWSVGRLNVVCYSLLICRYSIQHNNTQHNDIKNKGLFDIPSILAFKINEIQHKHHYPSVIILNVASYLWLCGVLEG